MTSSSEQALEHLFKLKPLDGWSIERKGPSQMRLVRRNVPLTDNFFLDIHKDGSDVVVGILSVKDDKAQGKILVDKYGKPAGSKASIITVSDYRTHAPVDHVKNMQTLTYAGYFVGALIATRAVATTLLGLSTLLTIAVPFAYLYLVVKCPKPESFETKKELKRVMRGHHLPEDHPDKPKGLFNQTLARISASVATELATGLGYQLEIIPLAGAGHLAKVIVPTAHMEFYWIGAAEGWHYVYSREI